MLHVDGNFGDVYLLTQALDANNESLECYETVHGHLTLLIEQHLNKSQNVVSRGTVHLGARLVQLYL